MMNKPTVLSSGEWLLAVARWHQEGSAQVYQSADHGVTWALLGQATVPREEDRSGDEHMIVELGDGRLWMLVRTAYGIGQSLSHDRGKTWSPVEPSGIPHPAARFFVRRLRSGRILLVKHGPMDRRTGRSHLTAFLSEDDGDSWSGGLLLDERNGVSYPDGVQTPDGTIYVIYDYDRRGEKEILMAAFTEGDIVRGACDSDAGALRVLINKATGDNPNDTK
jgi:predicted neuraminidase